MRPAIPIITDIPCTPKLIANTCYPLTQPGITFGKGGLLSAIWLTILDATGRTGRTDVSFNEWLTAIRKDQPAQHRKSIQWSRILLGFHFGILCVSLWSGL